MHVIVKVEIFTFKFELIDVFALVYALNFLGFANFRTATFSSVAVLAFGGVKLSIEFE